ncbi:hypothetical protein UFOVP23_12 [uncultured Caudovirales phage]|uniref:Uncharacterized protein n=1 Tax=uncultured Caudovirales phage TaxID=2100421 RepID=A0A6J5TB95_9CAUD|nr:hypothetical protein UFOVP23_12 [uncultured Caudovirales phage]
MTKLYRRTAPEVERLTRVVIFRTTPEDYILMRKIANKKKISVSAAMSLAMKDFLDKEKDK